MKLTGRIAFVVGGSGAIGQATAARLAEEGAVVILGFNSNEAAARVSVSKLTGTGHGLLKMNVMDPNHIEAAVRYLDERFGKLDILINASGTTRKIPHHQLRDLSDAVFDEIMQQNVRCIFSVVRACVPLLKRGPDSCIINISSSSATTGRGSNIAYCASKAALDNLGLTLARVLGPEIRVLTVSPGAVDSPFVYGRTHDELEEQAKQTALRKIVSANDVALAVLACITHMPASSGNIITVNGCPL